MISEAQTAVRNVGLLMAQKGSHILTGLLYAALVPRLMGPSTYGRYALLTSVLIWFALVSGMSAAQVMSRFVPQFTVRDDKEGLQEFFGSLLALRLANGAVAALLYFFVTSLWFPDLDRLALIIVALSVFVRSAQKLMFALFLGLNQAARWGMSETVNRWVALVLIIMGFHFYGLRGACFGLLTSELVVLSMGMLWARDYISWSKLRLNREYLAPYLRFSLSFYASNVLMSVSQHSGEALMRAVSGDYAEVGYFGVAYRIYLIAATTIWQFTMAFNPLLNSLQAQGKTEEVRRWVERLLKLMAVGGIFAIFGALLIGNDVVPFALGADYLPVAANLIALTLALLTHGLGSVARLLALIHNRPGVALQAASINVLAFIGIGVSLIPWRGSLAGCLSVLAASLLYASYFTWRMRGVMKYSLRNWALPILLGGLFLPLVLLRSSWPVNVALFGLFVAFYTGALFLLKIITRAEIAKMMRGLRPTAVTPEA